jgi:acyl transferase domain-containing protein
MQSLVAMECSVSVSIGVNLTLAPDTGQIFKQAGMLALDGRCKTLDADADGYVRGEACGALCISRHDGEDDLLLVTELVGSAVNQDGRSSALTAPNGPAQQQVITRAVDNSELDLRSMEGFQLHGTGTPLGDPIEIGALHRVLSLKMRESPGKIAKDRSPILLLACKSSVGHTESAAGITGLIMALNTVQHHISHPILHLRTLNVHLSKMLVLNRGQVEDPMAYYTLPRQSIGRSSVIGSSCKSTGTSAFAYQGTNAHVII